MEQIVGIAAVILPVGSMIYDWQTAVVAAPPIAGGFVAAFEMSKTSLAKGLPHLSTIALLLLALLRISSLLHLTRFIKI